MSHAKAHGDAVVTHEVGQKGSYQPSLKRLKIPDVCCLAVFTSLGALTGWGTCWPP
ncbi:MAG: hypothetical protein CO105_15635 [Comamonadaceae bacterium CG_4_9_14_3_um_filter_60_33]|nr:MAG: hypothetical protein CO105_15635 [Comamonadaceae bacterium CG_4_9_14_3_um_filter_60_33]